MAGKREGDREPRSPGPGRPQEEPEEIPGSDIPEDVPGPSGPVIGPSPTDPGPGAPLVPPPQQSPTVPPAPPAPMPEPAGATPIQGTFAVPGSRAARPFVAASPAPQAERSYGARIAPFLSRGRGEVRASGAPSGGPGTFSDLFGGEAFASDLARELARRHRPQG